MRKLVPVVLVPFLVLAVTGAAAQAQVTIRQLAPGAATVVKLTLGKG
jgi:hypothetical protein